MAPEQIEYACEVDARADIYSLGATFYKLLTGQSPIHLTRRSSQLARLRELVQAPATPITNYFSELSNELVEILYRMLAKATDDRYATGQQVADALKPFSSGHDLSRLLCVPTGHHSSELR